MNDTNNSAIISSSNQRITALKKNVSNGKTEVPIAGQLVKAAVILAVFQRALDTRAAVTLAHAAYKAALAERGAAETDRVTYDEGLKQWVLQRYGADSTEAHEFGYSARKVAVKSAETKAKAALLNAATRKARGTVGRKEKLKIKGRLDAPLAQAAPVAAQPANVAPAAIPPVTTAPAAVTSAPPPAAVAPATVGGG